MKTLIRVLDAASELMTYRSRASSHGAVLRSKRAAGWGRARGGPYFFVSLLVLIATVAVAAAQAADFTGKWERNAKLSQSPFDKIERVFGSGQASGAGGRQYDVFSRTGLLKDVDRVTLRRMLLDYAAVVESLEVELEGQEMTVSVGNDDYFALFYLDGRPHSRQIEEGLLLEATARREGDNVHVEQKGEDGVIREVFSLLDDGKQLAVIFEIEHKALEAPFMFRTVYDRVP